MIVFNCTKSAANYLFPNRRQEFDAKMHGIRPVPDFAIDYRGKKDAPVTQWMVTHKNLRGDHILYVCHAKHRYVISLTGIDKGDVESFLFLVHGRLMAQFACWTDKMAFKIPLQINEWMENYFDAHQGMYFCQRWDPSIQSSISKVSFELETDFEIYGRLPENQEEGTLFDIEANLRFDHPAKIARNIIPTNEVFIEFLNHYMGIPKKDIMRCRSAAEKFFKETTLNHLYGYDELAKESSLETLEAEHQELVEAGDKENAALFEALIKFKKLQNEQD